MRLVKQFQITRAPLSQTKYYDIRNSPKHALLTDTSYGKSHVTLISLAGNHENELEVTNMRIANKSIWCNVISTDTIRQDTFNNFLSVRLIYRL